MKNTRKSKTANHNYFNDINTEEKAYLLGFILADGCIIQKYGTNTITLHNSIDDIEIGKVFQNEIFPKNVLTIRENINKKSTFQIKGSSKQIISDLSLYNINPNKTYDFDFTFPFDKIQEIYLRHFMRGFFDGDGTFTQNRFEFITTSYNFAMQIKDIICSRFNVKCSIRSKKTKNVIEYMFYFCQIKGNTYKKFNFINDLYKWFYEDSKIFLNRKKVKFESYLEYRANSTDNIVE